MPCSRMRSSVGDTSSSSVGWAWTSPGRCLGENDTGVAFGARRRYGRDRPSGRVRKEVDAQFAHGSEVAIW
jgi:hypothetical protein